ncbi:MAG: flavodoxin [Haliea sp.]|mgnify:FL=1|jgi:hypothetical protein|nr:flavodoxin [Haliea sp.]MDP4789921.1 flavodoxin [Haliea sp.]MDP4916183.1 flavodoxin [Haliea sp.]MDP5065473.1 flavodoxin [Haliea sp.]
MHRLVIVYHSQSGASARLAAAAMAGAQSVSEVSAVLYRAWDAGAQEVLAADGLMLVAAENAGALSGTMKDFLDRTFYPVWEQGRVLPYALLLSAGNDGRGARSQAQRILAGYPMREALEPLICRGVVDVVLEARAREFGAGFAAGLGMGIF